MDKGDAAPTLEGRRVLVTGARGFLGSHLCRRLLAGGAEVHAVSRTARPSGGEDGLRWWPCDPVDADAAHELVSRVKPGVVIHLAGMVTAAPDLGLVVPTFHSLLASTVHMLTAAAQVGGCRVVLSGSLEEPTGGSADTLVPASPYAAAKLAAGAYARMFAALYGTSVVSLRPFMTYGPGQHPTKVVPSTILSLLDGRAPELSSGERPLDWIYVEDVVDAFLAAAVRPGLDGRTLDLGWGTAVRLREVVMRLVRLVDPSIAPRFGARADRPDQRPRVADVAATAAALGWRPRTPLDAGLAATVEWYRRGGRPGAGSRP